MFYPRNANRESYLAKQSKNLLNRFFDRYSASASLTPASRNAVVEFEPLFRVYRIDAEWCEQRHDIPDRTRVDGAEKYRLTGP